MTADVTRHTLSAREAAVALGISEGLVRRLIARGEIPERCGSQLMAQRLVDRKTAAEYLGITEPALKALCYRRRIPFVKVGRVTRFDMRALDKFIASNTTPAETGR